MKLLLAIALACTQGARHAPRPGSSTKGGPFFVKLAGPAKTVAKWEATYDTFLKSLRVE